MPKIKNKQSSSKTFQKDRTGKLVRNKAYKISHLN